MIIAIDGPAASGKSTVSRAVARRLRWRYLDTGAMYRAVAAEALREGVDLDDGDSVSDLSRRAPIRIIANPADPVDYAISIAGRDVTAEIRTPAVDAAVSLVARVPGVRETLVALQRAMADADDVVVEGRDIGSVVFPDAEVKVYLTASEQERARRRLGDRQAAGQEARLDQVAENIATRDGIDSGREASPLTIAEDAHVVDTTDMSVDQVVGRIVALAEEASR